MTATRLSFSYSEEMKKKLQDLATKDNRSLSSYVQIILSDHIEGKSKKKRTKKTKKA